MFSQLTSANGLQEAKVLRQHDGPDRGMTEEPLDYAERWLRDGLQVLRPALFVAQVTVDMTHATQRLEDLRRSDVPATSTHLLVRAAARALAANPDLHQLICGTRRLRPGRVDIGLSISGDKFVNPVLVLEGADRKTVAELAAETYQRVPEAREADRRMQRMLRRWGCLVPFGFLRRALLRLLFRSATFRRKGAGTFQVSTAPLDWAMTSTFASAGVLVGGTVRPCVVVVAGQPAVRPVMKLTLSGDHGMWDGRGASRFLAAVKADLEEAPEEGLQ
jgi:pyruvate/2-oxoglutarate dehydrogenase complex dihydrolipoamide acyltransferase (E2) component